MMAITAEKAEGRYLVLVWNTDSPVIKWVDNLDWVAKVPEHKHGLYEVFDCAAQETDAPAPADPFAELVTYGCPECDGEGCDTCNGHGVLYVRPK